MPSIITDSPQKALQKNFKKFLFQFNQILAILASHRYKELIKNSKNYLIVENILFKIS